MTKEEFSSQIEARRCFEFEYDGKTWAIDSQKMPDGKLKIFFGEQYVVPEEYENFTHLMADAKIGNHFLREVISRL